MEAALGGKDSWIQCTLDTLHAMRRNDWFGSPDIHWKPITDHSTPMRAAYSIHYTIGVSSEDFLQFVLDSIWIDFTYIVRGVDLWRNEFIKSEFTH